MDLRYYVTFPAGNGHLCWPMGTPFWDTAGRFCSWHSLQLGTSFLKSKAGKHLGILSLHCLRRHFPWSTYSFIEEGERILARGAAVLPQSGGSLFSPAQVNTTDRTPLTQWDIFLPRGLSIWPHPEKWSPWVQCKSPFPGHGAPGSPRTEGSTPAAPWDCYVIWPGSPFTRAANVSKLQDRLALSSPSRKGSQMGQCFLQRLLINHRSHVFRCSDHRGSLPLLK